MEQSLHFDHPEDAKQQCYNLACNFLQIGSLPDWEEHDSVYRIKYQDIRVELVPEPDFIPDEPASSPIGDSPNRA